MRTPAPEPCDTARLLDRLLSAPATPLAVDVDESGWESFDPPDRRPYFLRVLAAAAAALLLVAAGVDPAEPDSDTPDAAEIERP